MKQSNAVKQKVQNEAWTTWHYTGRVGTIAAGTGFGKSKLAVMEVQHMHEAGYLIDNNEVLLVSPTTKLRDDNWPKEFEDWGAIHLFKNHVKSICFASLKKERELLKETGRRYKLVILDEIHRLTELSAQAFATEGEDAFSEFFSEDLTDAILGLTATEPHPKRDPDKTALLEQIAPVVFRYSLDQGVQDGLIADYQIRVIWCPPDDVNKTIAAGSKKKPFKTTEAKQYDYMTKQMQHTAIQIDGIQKQLKENTFDLFADPMAVEKAVKNLEKLRATQERQVFARARMIYNLESKTKLAERCIAALSQQNIRLLVFCGGITQANRLLGDRVFHSKSTSAAFDAFNRKEINMLGVVNAANEGINFVDLDQALIIQVDSNARNLTQRVGRLLRIREGHIGVIYILCAPNTIDQTWLESSLAGFNPNKITYFNATYV